MLPPVAWVRVSWQQQFGGSGSLANRPDRCHAPWPGFCRPLFLLIRLSCRCIHSCIHESQLSVLSVCVWMYKPMCGFPDPFPSFLRAPFSTLHLRVSRLSWHFLASPSNNKRCMWTPPPSGSGQGENDETSAFAMAKYWISDSMKWIGDWMGRNGLEIGDFSETFCKRFACDYGALMPSVEGLYLALFWAFLLPGNTQGIKIRFAVLCPVKCLSVASQFLWFFSALSKASIKSDIPLNW